MTDTDLISVVIPNYNNGRYLPSCLDSVLGQDHADIEVIVIDDCSTDDSPGIIRDYTSRDPRIVPVFNSNNNGVAKSRHKGIVRSQGRYITTLDSDDVLLRQDKLSREFDLMCSRREAGEENVITFSGIILLHADGTVQGPQHATIREGDILNALVRRTCLIPRDFLFTREQYLQAGGFDNRFPMYEDWDLKIRLAQKNRFYYSGIDGIGYRRHGQGLSAAAPLTHAWWLCRIFVKNFRLLRTERLRTIRVFSRLIRRMARNHFREGRRR